MSSPVPVVFFFYMNGGKTNKEKRWEDGEMKEERKA